MIKIIFLTLSVIAAAGSVPIDNPTTNQNSRVEDSTNQPNQVQEFFDNMSNNTQNGFNTLKEWFSRLLTTNANIQGASENLPVVYMGSFQLLKMPMPAMTDVIKGMGNLASFAQTLNKLTPGLPTQKP